MGSLAHDQQAISHQKLIQHHLPDHDGHYGELSHIGHHAPEHHTEYAWSYPSYEFSYTVADPHTHDNKGHHETRNGDTVKGMYWLMQPDGLKRTVTYYADKHSGFNAQVEYSDPYYHKQVHQHQEPKSEVYAIINSLPHDSYNAYANDHHEYLFKPLYDQYNSIPYDYYSIRQ
ncbi:unnamed protein product [Parnassius apollo]|uniref:(apollo) hypothetical protein n=1 Tax=Parnassius apollo TaxID=110799 RepID=A0A8S3W5A5_PARAO|nr:unnamed protein product [Parnassius apollo]